MMDQENSIDFLQVPRIQQLKKQIAQSDSDNDKKRFIALLVKEIIKAIDSPRKNDSISVNNLDEITASLRNELNRANKVLVSALKNVEISGSGSKISDTVSVNNLKDLKKYFDSINRTLKKYSNIKIPAPQVTVNPTPVFVSPAKVEIPKSDPINFDPLIKSIDKNLQLLRTNNKSHPLAVRLSDGGDWIKELKKQTAQTTQYMSDVSYIRDSSGQRINPATAEGQNPGFQIPRYDYISLSPATQPTSIVYKLGGSSGVTVATLTITYSGSEISSVTRT